MLVVHPVDASEALCEVWMDAGIIRHIVLQHRNIEKLR